MMLRLTKPVLSITSSLAALLFGAVLLIIMRYLPEQQSVLAFFVFAPATLIFAWLGYVLGASSTAFKHSPAAIGGYLIGGCILLAIVLRLISFMG